MDLPATVLHPHLYSTSQKNHIFRDILKRKSKPINAYRVFIWGILIMKGFMKSVFQTV